MITTRRQDCSAYYTNQKATRWTILVRLNGRGTSGIKMLLEGIKAPDRDKAIDKVMRILNDITIE